MNIVFLDSGSLGIDLDVSVFERFGHFTHYPTTNPDQVANRTKQADIILTNKIVLTNEVLSNSQVKLIAITATGINVVDTDYCQAEDIAVTNVAGYSTHSVAQHTLALVLGLLENLCYYDQYTKSKQYVSNAWGTHQVRRFYELNGKNWGIIGLGNIGKATAKLARAFGAQVRYYSTSGLNQDPTYERSSLEDLLAESDIVSLHAPLNADTHHLLNRTNLGLMKENAIVCNVARGPLVDEEAMASALKADQIRGYATDVFSLEPPALDNPLFAVASHKLLMTPHIGFCSDEAREALIDELLKNIEAFLNGEKRNRVV